MKNIFREETSVVAFYKKLISEETYDAMLPDHRLNDMVAKIFELLTAKHLDGKMIPQEERFLTAALDIIVKNKCS